MTIEPTTADLFRQAVPTLTLVEVQTAIQGTTAWITTLSQQLQGTNSTLTHDQKMDVQGALRQLEFAVQHASDQIRF